MSALWPGQSENGPQTSIWAALIWNPQKCSFWQALRYSYHSAGALGSAAGSGPGPLQYPRCCGHWALIPCLGAVVTMLLLPTKLSCWCLWRWRRWVLKRSCTKWCGLCIHQSVQLPGWPPRPPSHFSGLSCCRYHDNAKVVADV